MEAHLSRKEGDKYLDVDLTYQQLEEEMVAFAKMFTDLHDLVYTQQPILDIIENNISKSKLKVNKTEDKLQTILIHNNINRKIVAGCMTGLMCFAIFGPVSLIYKVAVCSLGTGIVYVLKK